MRSKWVMGNWKMNGSYSQAQQLGKDIINNLTNEQQSNCVIFPPALFMSVVDQALSESNIRLGIQNIYPAVAGAFTGENAVSMLEQFNCKFVLVGHSERRQIFGENEKFVAEKFHHAKEHGMIPVLCVGETLQEREKGLTEEVLFRQIHAVLENDATCFENSVVAYEPVWAIGTGQTATTEQAQEAHAYIRKLVAEHSQTTASGLSILYGGSVNENNADALFAMPDVDGGLVGGASLNAQKFAEIVKCIN